MEQSINTVNGHDFSNLPIKINLVGKVDDREWPHYLYNVIITGKNGFWSIPYKCGLGHVIKAKYRNQKPKPKYPTNSDIMYSLLSDSDAAEYNFSDWCDCLGYDNDSLKAVNTYNTCCEYSVKLKKYFSREQLEEMKTALEDY